MNSSRRMIPTWLIVLGFVFQVWPGIILLIIRILQEASADNTARRSQEARERSWRKSGGTRTYQPPRDAQVVGDRPADDPQTAQSAPQTQTQTQTQAGAPQAPRAPRSAVRPQPAAPAGFAGLTRRQRELISGAGGKGMWIGGLITLGAGVFTTVITLLGTLAGGSFLEGLLASGIVAASICTPGAVLAIVGNKRRNRAARCRNYLAMVGDRRRAALDDLAASIPTDWPQVRRDLEWMLDEGFFPGCYIDGSTHELTCPEEKEKARAAAAAQEAPAKAVPDADGCRRYPEEKRIRELNDLISDSYISARMERLEELTHNILAYAEEHPEKENDLRQFRAHYLPTTLKILESYARFEKQNVAGENIRTAMKDVESIMDKLVAGFEKQLDALCAAEALDVTTDISVLENMLNLGGLGPLSPFETHSRKNGEDEGR